ncbi:MAG: RNA-binding cell elongation regulator Jag/EloR [Clostridia bacterium]
MPKSIEVQGNTVAEAIQRGLSELDVSIDEVEREVLSQPKSGFFGFGASKAKVRLTLKETKEEKTKEVKHEPKQAVKKEVKDEPKKEPKAEVKTEIKEKAPKKAQEKTSYEPKNSEKQNFEEKTFPVIPKKEVLTEKEQIVKEFIDGLLEKMDINGTCEILVGDADTVNACIEGENLGNAIGRRGDTLDAIQYIANLVSKKSEEKDVKVRLNCENYREKRDLTLEKLAYKMGNKVLKNKKNMTLEPMNPYERRKIHEVLQDFEGVYTYSTGKEPSRRVVIGFGEGKKDK